MAIDLATRAGAAVVVISSSVDLARGLPMTELVAVLDGGPGCDELVSQAEQWAQLFKLRLVLTAVAAQGPSTTARASSNTSNREPIRSAPGGVGVELVRGTTVAGLRLLAGDEVVMPPTRGVIVYQEQVMLIAQKLAGYTLGGGLSWA